MEGRDEKGRFVPGVAGNPEGKGGFGDHAEHRASGRWKPENSDSYNFNMLSAMTLTEYAEWKKRKRADKSMTVVEARVVARIDESIRDQGKHREAFTSHEMILDRTEGRPRMTLDQNLGGQQDNRLEIVFTPPAES